MNWNRQILLFTIECDNDFLFTAFFFKLWKLMLFHVTDVVPYENDSDDYPDKIDTILKLIIRKS